MVSAVTAFVASPRYLHPLPEVRIDWTRVDDGEIDDAVLADSAAAMFVLMFANYCVRPKVQLYEFGIRRRAFGLGRFVRTRSTPAQ